MRKLCQFCCCVLKWIRFGEGGDRAAGYRADEGAAPVDFDLARMIGALSPAHREAVRTLVKALKRGEAKE